MGFRFRKSVKLFPGVRINLSKSGPSLSVGGRGHTLNVSSRGTRATVGIPGTGVSFSKRLSSATAPRQTLEQTPPSTGPKSAAWIWFIFIAGLVVLFLLLK